MVAISSNSLNQLISFFMAYYLHVDDVDLGDDFGHHSSRPLINLDNEIVFSSNIVVITLFYD